MSTTVSTDFKVLNVPKPGEFDFKWGFLNDTPVSIYQDVHMDHMVYTM
jgi:hypothetical protein